MAKKPPQAPPPSPLDDFDPDKILGEDIAPIEDADVIDPDLIEPEPDSIESVSDELVSDELVQDVIEPDQLVPEGEPDLFGDLSSEPAASKPIEPAGDLLEEEPLLDVETSDDEVVDPSEVSADESVVIDESEVGDELVALDEHDSPSAKGGEFSLDDDDGSPHESETVGEMPALDEEDSDSPFAGGGTDEADEDEDLELVGAGVKDGGDFDDPDEPYQEEEIPKPRTHWFAWTLIAFNLLAVGGAAYVVAMSYAKRQEYTYAVIRTELIMLGLPNEDESKAMTAARSTLPTYRIPAEDVKRIVNERLVAARSPQTSDNFKDLEEAYGKRIPPEYLTDKLIKEHFAHFGPTVEAPEKVVTVEDEMRRLKNKVVNEIKTAAKASLAATGDDPAKLRAKIKSMIMPLASNFIQCEKLDKLIDGTQKKEDLDKLYVDAAERRMAFDFLLPLELFRPGEINAALVERPNQPARFVESDKAVKFVESFGDLEKLPLKDVFDRVEQRIASTYAENYVPAIHFDNPTTMGWDQIKRDTIEKRLTMAFTMIALAHVKSPEGTELFPNLMKRIPLVVGQYDFTLACELFPRGLLDVNERVLNRIAIDREGSEVYAKVEKDAKGEPPLLRNKRFIDFYEEELENIRYVQYDIIKAKIRLADLEKQKKRYTGLLAERKVQFEQVMKKIATSRAKTAKQIAELRIFQNELFRYELELATAEEELAVLYREIETKLSRPGGKSP